MSRLFLVTVLCLPPSLALAESQGQTVDFRSQILPLLADRCFACDGPDEETRQAELRFDSRESVFAKRDRPLLVPGESSKSELYRRLTSRDPDVHMPPADATRQLSAEEVDLFRRWIDQGGDWQEHWSLTPVKRPAIPEVSDPDWPRNSLDRFVLARLDAEKFPPSREADRTRLARRVTLALTGLPPTRD